ncbi:hypothetical protein U472_05780 [Orenia metallireducens]|uniref:TM2 domain-containing protein n=1 Tax=Orenia metallireducens TaxID=1413210 RepID=A0A1C0A9P3_9FIRM|nr:TM2 domain-containing protein [Orenia metallireducens]OCL26995.1 hypothetical protein U472_05780 [Orenia metallireducens]
MNCYIHPKKESIGTCVTCGKFICNDCNTELSGKNHCKQCVSEIFEESKKKMDKLEDNKQQQPMVFMNAGGGGGSSSSSSSSSSSTGTASVPSPHKTLIPLKSKVIAALLAIFLGTFGIHKFYLDKTGQGIVYLLLCWTGIPTMIGLIEGLVYLSTNDYIFAAKYGGRYI